MSKLAIPRVRARARYGPRWSHEMVAKSRIAKVYAADVGVRVTGEAQRLMGSNGYSRPYDVEKHWRDVKITNNGWEALYLVDWT